MYIQVFYYCCFYYNDCYIIYIALLFMSLNYLFIYLFCLHAFWEIISIIGENFYFLHTHKIKKNVSIFLLSDRIYKININYFNEYQVAFNKFV